MNNIYNENPMLWNNLVPEAVLYQQTQTITPQFQVPLSDPRISLDCSDEEVWIPSDQTIHWGKRPNYLYPSLRLATREDLSAQHHPLNVPRGSRLVAKLWFSEWSWDEPQINNTATANDNISEPIPKMPKPDPTVCSCFEDEKTMVPFEKGCAVFRHLRISKNIKLKKTETISITGLGFEIGYHNPFTKTPFKSLEIFVSKAVKIHIVAHKGSVKLMQKHGLLPQTSLGYDTPQSLPVHSDNNNNNNNTRVGSLPPHPSTKNNIPINTHNHNNNKNNHTIQSQTPQAFARSSTSLPPNPREIQVANTEPSNQSNTLVPELPPINVSSTSRNSRQPGDPAATMLNALDTAVHTLEEAQNLMSNTGSRSHLLPNNNSSTNSTSNSSRSSNTSSLVISNNNGNPNKRSWTQIIPNSQPTSGDTTLGADLEAQKRIKASQMGEIIEELSSVQQQLDALKRRIYEFMTIPNPSPAPKIVSKLFRIACSGDRIKMNAFVFYAFRTKNLELGVSLIKTFGFDINERNSLGYTLLHVAAKHQFQEGVHWCLQRGADVNAITQLHDTPLHFAYLRNDKSIRKVLKEAGADRDAMNVYGLKPKDYKNNRKPIIKPFSESLFSVEVTIEGFDKPFFVEIWFAARIGWLEVVRLYIEQLNCDVDIKNTNGQTPLMCATEHRQEDCVRYLLQMGADPNARDIHDSTALHYAYTNYEQCKTIVDMLEKHGADPTLKNIFNRTPLFYKNKNLDNHWNTVWNL